MIGAMFALHSAPGAKAAASPCKPDAKVYVIVRASNATVARGAILAFDGKLDKDLGVLDAAAGWVSSAAVPALQASPGVVAVTTDANVRFQSVPADVAPSRPATGVFPAVVGAPAAWQQGLTGSGVGVAVIDTGIAAVPGLAGRLAGGVDFTGGNDPYHDGYGHGTFVAGLVAGATSGDGTLSGVAPDADLISVKVAGDDGSTDVSQVLAAIQWVVSMKDQLGIRIVNLSLGTDSTQSVRHSLLNFAVERAWDAGLVVVVSASNLGPLPGTVTKPGDDPLVITAGATDDAGTVDRSDDSMAGFSGAGPTLDGITKPDIVAPGRSVVSLRAPGSRIDTDNPGSRVGDAYFMGSGTSFSTAITSGAAALLLQSDPTMTADQVKGRLLASAAPGPVGNANIDGRGALDVGAALARGPVTFSQAGIKRSAGDGTLGADRGHVGARVGAIAPPSGCAALATPVGLTGEVTAQNRSFNHNEYVGKAWTSSSWYSSSWYSSSWYSSSWYSSSWYSSSWYSSSWYSSSWYAVGWN